MNSARIFLALLLLLPLSTTAQLKDEYAWRIFQASEKKRDTKIINQLKDNGYKYDLDSMRNGRMIVRLEDPTAFARLYRKKITFTIGMDNGDTIMLSGLEVKEQLFNQYLDSVAMDSPESDAASYRKGFNKMLKGKAPFPDEAPDVWYIDFGCFDYFDTLIGLDFKRKHKYIGHLGFINATGDIAKEFPVYEPAECSPVDRYLNFLSLKDLNDHNIKPFEHKLKKGRKLSKEFILTFDHNKSGFKTSEVERIIQYLEDSSLTIYRAYIRGMSSIEGDSLNNANLQRKRADILWQTLEPYAGAGVRIGGDYKEGWKIFRAQMKKAGIHDFDSMSNDQVRKMFMDKKLRRKYEPFFKKQRVARLRLNLYKTFNNNEIVSVASAEAGKLFKELLEAAYRGSPSVQKRNTRKLIGRILGIEEALINEVKAGRITGEEVVNRYRFDRFQTDNLIMARFYYMKRNYERGNYPVLPNTKNIIMAAHELALPKITSPYFSDSNIPLRKAVDIQLLTYRLIKKGYLATSVFHELSYEDDPKYYHLQMNKLYYNQHYLRIYSNPELVASADEETYMTAEQYRESRYYYYLKKWLVDGNNNIRSQVMRKDKHYFIDIWDLLYYNVDLWDPVANTFYDEDISVEVMDKLLNQLQATNLCPEQKYEMALNFHRKVLISSTYDKEPSEQFKKSYRYVVRYYKRRSYKLDAKSVEKVARQLVFVSHLYYKNESFKDAHAILQPHHVAGDLDLRGEEFFHELSFAVGELATDYPDQEHIY